MSIWTYLLAHTQRAHSQPAPVSSAAIQCAENPAEVCQHNWESTGEGRPTIWRGVWEGEYEYRCTLCGTTEWRIG